MSQTVYLLLDMQNDLVHADGPNGKGALGEQVRLRQIIARTADALQTAVRDAHDRDYEVVVLEDCCAAHSALEHANSIESIRRFCRIETAESVAFV